MADKWQVDLFLSQFKQCWPPKCYTWPRLESNQALIDLGITPKQRREIILHLTHMNYVHGPTPDDKRPGDIWVFGDHVNGIEFYIKLKISPDGSEANTGLCMSFKPSAEKMNYPFR